MSQRMFGLETEHAFVALDKHGKSLDKGAAIERLMNTARRILRHLPDAHHGGLFLQNGSCLYIDCGLHPELATPECTTPWEAVRYLLAGERIMASIADDMVASDDQTAEAFFFRCNVDYSGVTTTWGCHESYLHQADPAAVGREILPHLVSRIIYTGAGGFDNTTPGLRFVISPRVPHLVKETSASSTGERGIFHTKDEPLCRGGYHRLHVLSGESMCSQTGSFLKVGCTALIVAMIEAGLQPAEGIYLQSPLDAMRRFASDMTCSAAVPSTAGKLLKATDIQRRYLEVAEAHLGNRFMPDWAPQVCEEWRAILDRIDAGSPNSIATTIDWAIKLALYKAYVASCGLDPAALLRGCATLPNPPSQPQVMRTLLGTLPNQSPVRELRADTPDDVRARGLRGKCFEIDMRFGQCGDGGVFAAMDRAGVLDHRVPGVDDIEGAMTDPPAVGRAHVRGECVRRFANANGRYMCDWSFVSDAQAGAIIDLADPWAEDETWRTSGPVSAIIRPRARVMRGPHVVP